MKKNKDNLIKCPKCNKDILYNVYKCPYCEEKIFESKKVSIYHEDDEETFDDGLKPMESHTTHQYFKTTVLLGSICLAFLLFIIIGTLITSLLKK